MLTAAAILVILALLLASPVTVTAFFEQELALKLRYLFLRFSVLPVRNKPKKEKEKPDKKKKTPQSSSQEKKINWRDILRRRGVDGLLAILQESAALAGSVLRNFFSHIKVMQFDLCLRISSEDAAETALWYGRTCAAVYPAVGELMQACGCRHFGVSVVPDFDSSEPKVHFLFRAKISLFFLLKESLAALFRAAKLWAKFREPDVSAQPETSVTGTK